MLGRLARYFIWDNRKQPALAKQIRRLANEREWDTRTLRDVQQRKLSIRKIQDPETGVNVLSDSIAAGSTVKVALAQLRLAIGVQVAIAAIVLKNVENCGTHAERGSKLLRLDKLEIVRRSVILRKTPPHTPHQ